MVDDAERSEAALIVSSTTTAAVIVNINNYSEWAEGEGAANDGGGGSEFERSEDELWLYW